jgi:hypothetical protein
MTQINTDKKAKVKNEVLFLSVLIRVHPWLKITDA